MISAKGHCNGDCCLPIAKGTALYKWAREVLALAVKHV